QSPRPVGTDHTDEHPQVTARSADDVPKISGLLLTDLARVNRRQAADEGSQKRLTPRRSPSPGGPRARQAEHGFFHGPPGSRLQTQAPQRWKRQQRQTVYVTQIHNDLA